MTASAAAAGARSPLAQIEPRLLRAAAVGGLLGGLAMFFVMAGYNASAGMGFWTILNVCFASWVFRGTTMTATMPGKFMTGSPMPAHTAMPEHSAMAGTSSMGQHAMGAASIMNQPVLASHVIVAGLLHPAMSAFAGAAFPFVLTVLVPP